jgi:hypothetical protein
VDISRNLSINPQKIELGTHISWEVLVLVSRSL